MIREERVLDATYLRHPQKPVQGLVIRVGWTVLGVVFELREGKPPHVVVAGFFPSYAVAVERVSKKIQES